MSTAQRTFKLCTIFFFIVLTCSILIASACSNQHAQPISAPAVEQAAAETQPAPAVAPARADAVPQSYTENCAKCHGAAGEGKKSGKDKGPLLTDVTTRDEDQLNAEQISLIIDDAEAQGLNSKMPAFKDKLSTEQKKAIVDWVVALGSDDKTPEHIAATAK